MKLLVYTLRVWTLMPFNDFVLMTNYEDLMRKYFEAVIETYSIFMKVDDDVDFVINGIISEVTKINFCVALDIFMWKILSEK